LRASEKANALSLRRVCFVRNIVDTDGTCSAQRYWARDGVRTRPARIAAAPPHRQQQPRHARIAAARSREPSHRRTAAPPHRRTASNLSPPPPSTPSLFGRSERRGVCQVGRAYRLLYCAPSLHRRRRQTGCRGRLRLSARFFERRAVLATSPSSASRCARGAVRCTGRVPSIERIEACAWCRALYRALYRLRREARVGGPPPLREQRVCSRARISLARSDRHRWRGCRGRLTLRAAAQSDLRERPKSVSMRKECHTGEVSRYIDVSRACARCRV
jgi:hypothetical protein